MDWALLLKFLMTLLEMLFPKTHKELTIGDAQQALKGNAKLRAAFEYTPQAKKMLAAIEEWKGDDAMLLSDALKFIKSKKGRDFMAAK